MTKAPLPVAAFTATPEEPFLFDVNTQKLEPRYLQAIFTANYLEDQLGAEAKGTTGYAAVRPKHLLAAHIPLPPLAEQRRIVARIEELAAKVAEARRLRREAVREADSLSRIELKAIVIALFKRYDRRALAELILEAGYGTSIKCDYDRLDNASPVLRMPNVAAERINLEDLKFGTIASSEMHHVQLKAGDVLIVRTNGSLDLVGRCAVVPVLTEPTAFASYLIRIRFDHNLIEADFAQLMLKHLRTDGQLIDFARTTAGQFNVSLGRLRNGQIPLPLLPEQRRIVAYLDGLQAKVDALRALQAETQAELDALLPAVLDKAFKGEL